jgi:signal transduction histidine kinase
MVPHALPAAPPAPSPFRAPSVPAPRAWDLPASIVLPSALLVALVMSTQYLFQPFVWRNWPLDEVLLGWFDVVRVRAITALAIGSALVLAGRVPARSALARALLVAAAVAVGAVVGELAPVWADAELNAHDLNRALGHVLRWSVVGGSVAAMVYLWRRVADVGTAAQAAELRRAQAERQLAQLRLQALRSRIEPHFLFNTLATVRRLHQTDPALGGHLLDQLLHYLRLTLSADGTHRATLGDEVDLVEAYPSVVAMRMSGRLTLHWDVPAALRACELPALTIATLVENAVKHGIAPRPEGGSIELRARAVGDLLEITVTDTGAGFSGAGGTGIGLANIRARLATLYGAQGTLELAGNQPRGVRARMCLPRRAVAAKP